MKLRCKIFLTALISCGLITSLKNSTGKIIISKPPLINYEEYNIEDNPLFATYNNGQIYITNNPSKIEEKENDIVIIDERDKKENIEIKSSYRIDDIASKLQIINLILEYNALYPSDTPWIRSKTSLLNEWTLHNIAFFWGYKRDHSQSVDFENSEEEKYDILRLTKKYK